MRLRIYQVPELTNWVLVLFFDEFQMGSIHRWPHSGADINRWSRLSKDQSLQIHAKSVWLIWTKGICGNLSVDQRAESRREIGELSQKKGMPKPKLGIPVVFVEIRKPEEFGESL